MTDDRLSRPSLRRSWAGRNWLRLVVNVVALVLLGRLVYWVLTDRFLFDPVKAIIVRAGRLAAVFLLLTLTCTPVALLTGWDRARRARRPLGLWSLGFVLVHFLAFVGWDYGFDLALLRIGLFSQPFVLVGLGAFLILVALGVSSWPGLRRRLGRSWLLVQRLVYLVVVLDVWHIVWAKKNILEAWRTVAVAALLLLVRLPPIQGLLGRARKVVQRSQA